MCSQIDKNPTCSPTTSTLALFRPEEKADKANVKAEAPCPQPGNSLASPQPCLRPSLTFTLHLMLIFAKYIPPPHWGLFALLTEQLQTSERVIYIKKKMLPCSTFTRYELRRRGGGKRYVLSDSWELRGTAVNIQALNTAIIKRSAQI